MRFEALDHPFILPYSLKEQKDTEECDGTDDNGRGFVAVNDPVAEKEGRDDKSAGDTEDAYGSTDSG